MRILSYVFVMFVCVAHAWADELKPGDLAPPLEIEAFLQNPEGYQSWDDLRGKVVVLEFWATWCGPCVAAMPHLNEITESYQDKDVVVIAITSEDQDQVERWQAMMRERRPESRIAVESVIGLDTDRSVGDAYNVRFIPHTVVVDGYGRIASITDPRELTHERMDAFLTGHRDTPEAAPDAPAPDGAAQEEQSDDPTPSDVMKTPVGIDAYRTIRERPMVSVTIAPSAGNLGVGAIGNEGMSIYNTSFEQILAHAWDAEPHELDYSAVEARWGLLDFIVSYPEGDRERGHQVARDVCLLTFELDAHVERREIVAYELRQVEGGHVMPLGFGANRGTRLRGLSFDSESTDISAISGFLAQYLEAPVDDKTGLEDFYTVELDLNGLEREDVMLELERQIGLTLVPVRRTIEVTVFKDAGAE